MMSLAEIFRTGGPAMYAVLLLNLLGGLLTLVMGIVGMFGKRVPLPLWLLMPSTVVAVGVAGMMYGISELEQAMAYATPATRSLLYIRGLSMAAAPLLFACMSAAVLLGLSAAAAGAGALTKVGTRAWTPLSAAGATLGCVVAIGVILAGGAMGNIGGSIFPGILVLMFVALGSLLAIHRGLFPTPLGAKVDTRLEGPVERGRAAVLVGGRVLLAQGIFEQLLAPLCLAQS